MPARLPSLPSMATLVAVKSARPVRHALGAAAGRSVDQPAFDVPEVQLRALTGLIKELERFLGPDYSHIPRRGL